MSAVETNVNTHMLRSDRREISRMDFLFTGKARCVFHLFRVDIGIPMYCLGTEVVQGAWSFFLQLHTREVVAKERRRPQFAEGVLRTGMCRGSGKMIA